MPDNKALEGALMVAQDNAYALWGKAGREVIDIDEAIRECAPEDGAYLKAQREIKRAEFDKRAREWHALVTLVRELVENGTI